MFEPHHYLKLPRMVAAEYFVGTVDGEPVCHLAVAPRLEIGGVRACRMVVMPEWQGAGIGIRFLNNICQWYVDGHSRYGDRPKAVYFHTSHPGLVAALRRDKKWVQVSANLYGGNKKKSAESIVKAQVAGGLDGPVHSGFGGHFRAVQGFKYIGERQAA